jgi:hypothetical protein
MDILERIDNHLIEKKEVDLTQKLKMLKKKAQKAEDVYKAGKSPSGQLSVIAFDVKQMLDVLLKTK